MKSFIKKAMAGILVSVMLLSGGIIPAFAETLSDGVSKTVTIEMGTRYDYLSFTSGNKLGGEAWTYTTDTGITGPAYCINHGLAAAPSTKRLPISQYIVNTYTVGAFANGYPQRSVEDFLKLYLANYPELAGLTEAEFAYATQISVWASLGQIAVEGTAFASGPSTLAVPSGDAQQIRTYRAVVLILDQAQYYDRQLKTGMNIRLNNDEVTTMLDIQTDNGLHGAAEAGSYELKKETIDGTEYYTREWIASSATSTFKNDFCIDLWLDNAPFGTMLRALDNSTFAIVTVGGHTVYKVPTYNIATNINSNGREYRGEFKICIPVSAVGDNGNITIHGSSTVSQYNIFLANNTDYTEQSYVIADPLYTPLDTQSTMKWTKTVSPYGKLIVHKVDDVNAPLVGAVFTIESADGSSFFGTSDANGLITWDRLNPGVPYTLRETQALVGYQLASPVNINIPAGATENITVTNHSTRNFKLLKVDLQNGYPLGQAVFRFEQIDGGYVTDATTRSDGYIEFTGNALPFGTYKIYEIQAPPGYQKDETAQTVAWNGSKDVSITFKDIRKPAIVLIKKDEQTNISLEGAVFNVYKDGSFITTITTNLAGEARLTDVTPGYWQFEETQAPTGYILDSTRHGINVNPYDPSSSNDPTLVVTDKAKGMLRVRKVDSTDGAKGLDGVALRVQSASMGYDQTFITSGGGWITASGMEPGDYLISETSTIAGYDLSSEIVPVTVHYGETATAVFKNEPHGKIIVIKENALGNEQLPGANIKITDKDGKTWDVTTGVDGTAMISDLPAGDYTVQELNPPLHFDLNSCPQTVTVKPGETTSVKIEDYPLGGLTITKVDADDSAKTLAGVKLRIHSDILNYDRTETTDNLGQIRLTDLLPGDYAISEVSTLSGYELSTEVIIKTVEYGKVTTATFTNHARGGTTVTKVDSITGAHLPNANIMLTSLDSGQTWDVTTGADGTATVTGLPSGHYTWQEKNPPLHYELNNQVFPVTVVNGQNSDTKIADNPLGSLLITKIDSKDSNKTLAGVRLRIHNDALNYDRTEVTDSKGQVRLDDLLPGDYTITEVATLPGYDLSSEVLVRTVEYGKVTTATFGNDPHGSATVIKADSVTGAHLQNANIILTSLESGQTWDATTGADGSATVSDLSPGKYTWQEKNPPANYELNPQVFNFTVVSGENSATKIEDNPLGSLLITKVSSKDSSTTLEGVKLRIYSDILNYDRTETTDAKGQIHLTGLYPADYYISEISTIPGYQLSTDVLIRTVQYGKETTVTFTNEPLGSATVIKTDSLTGVHLQGANIILTSLDSGQTWDVTTGADGSATISGLPSGHYTWQEKNPPLHYELNNQVFTVTVVNGQNSDTKITDNPLGSLLITKVDNKDSNKTLAGVKLRIHSDTLNYDRTEVTDSKGQIRLDDLLPGDYTITEVATLPGYDLSSEVLVRTVEYGKVTTATFGNDPHGSATVIKADSVTGLHLPNANILLTSLASGQTWDVTTGTDGSATVSDLSPGKYIWQEKNPPANYELNPQVFNFTVVSGENSATKIEDNPLGSLLITKVSSEDSSKTLEGVKLRIYSDTLDFDRTETTDAKGQIHLTGLFPADYYISEVGTILGYKLSTDVLIRTIEYGKETTVTFTNEPLGSSTVIKVDSLTGAHLPGANIKFVNPSTGQTWDVTTGTDGTATITDLADGEYYWQEQNPPEGYELNNQTYPVTVVSGENSSVKIQDNPLGALEITKINSLDATMTLTGVKLRVQNTDLSYDRTFTTDTNGKILISGLYPADYTITEVGTITGYILSTDVVTATVNYGQTTTVVFKNDPKPYIELLKIDSQSSKPVQNAIFKVINRNTQQVYNVTTDASGKAVIWDVDVGWYDIIEVTPPESYVPDNTVYSVYADVGKPGKITIKNTRMPALTILKQDRDTLSPLAGGFFTIVKVGEPNAGVITGSPFVTDSSGKIYIPALLPGNYQITEEQSPYGYNLPENPTRIITMVAGEDNTVIFLDSRQPTFTLTKTDSYNGNPIPNAQFTIEKLDVPGKGSLTGNPFVTNDKGQISILNLTSGMYRVTEVTPANGYGMPNPNVWEINIIANQDYNLSVKNTRLPSLVITKTDGLTFRGIPNTAFEVLYLVNGSMYGDTRSLGTYVTDKNGQIVIPNCQPGWYRYVETRPAPGYSKPSNPSHDVFLALGNNAYTGVGATAWEEVNGTAMITQASLMAAPMQAPVTASASETTTTTPSPTPAPSGTTVPSGSPDPAQSPADTPSTAPPSTSGTELQPTTPNTATLTPSKPNGSK